MKITIESDDPEVIQALVTAVRSAGAASSGGVRIEQCTSDAAGIRDALLRQKRANGGRELGLT